MNFWWNENSSRVTDSSYSCRGGVDKQKVKEAAEVTCHWGACVSSPHWPPLSSKNTLQSNGWSMWRSRHTRVKGLTLIRDRLCILDCRCSPEAAEMRCWSLRLPFCPACSFAYMHLALEQRCGAIHVLHKFHFSETGREAKHCCKSTRALVVHSNLVYTSAHAVFARMRACCCWFPFAEICNSLGM